MSRRFVPPSIALLLAEQGEADLPGAGDVPEGSYRDGHADGLRAGHAAGVREGAQAADEAHRPALSSAAAELTRLRAGADVADALDRVTAQRVADRAAMERLLRETLAAALTVLTPALLEVTGGRDAAALIAMVLAEREADQLTLAAHPQTLETLARSSLPGGFAQRVALRTDAAALPGALTISWTGGGLVHDPAGLLARVLETIDPGRLSAQGGAEEPLEPTEATP